MIAALTVAVSLIPASFESDASLGLAEFRAARQQAAAERAASLSDRLRALASGASSAAADAGRLSRDAERLRERTRRGLDRWRDGAERGGPARDSMTTEADVSFMASSARRLKDDASALAEEALAIGRADVDADPALAGPAAEALSAARLLQGAVSSAREDCAWLSPRASAFRFQLRRLQDDLAAAADSASSLVAALTPPAAPTSRP